MRRGQFLAGLAIILCAALWAAADTHAPWPSDWNNWNDPALWVTVGNPGNVGENSGQSGPDLILGTPDDGYGPDRICGVVPYEYKIGKFEVTAGQYTAFLNAVAATDTYGLYNTEMCEHDQGCKIRRDGTSGGYSYSVALDWANRPVNFVSWGDAARFANWLHNAQPMGLQDLSTTEDGAYYLNGAISDADLLAVTRKPNARYLIPSEDEWYKAAYYDPNKPGGAGYWDYPTGTNAPPSNDLINPDPGNNANFYIPGGDWTVGDPYYRTIAGEFENSESPYGTLDQGANVWEWTEVILWDNTRGLRGGSFYDDQVFWLNAARVLNRHPTYELMHSGFRIAEVPEPASMAVLLGGALGLLRARRRRESGLQ